MYETLRDFVQALDQKGELKRIVAPVSPILEITEIADRVSKSPAPNLPAPGTRRTDPRFHHLGGHALLFTNVQGPDATYDMPVLINSLGSYSRVELALGGDLATIAARIEKLAKPVPPVTFLEKLQKIPELLELAKIPPRLVRSALCHECVKTGEDVDLRRLPLIRCWPHDGDFAALGYPRAINGAIAGLDSGDEWERHHRGKYITLAGIHTIHADDAGHHAPPSRNIGMYRVQLLGKRHMAMHWHMHHDGARHWRSWNALGKKMPVAIALGGESVLPYAATAPMPPGISELLLAGFLNRTRAGIPLVRGKTVPLDVPANAEIVIEGYVSEQAGLPGWDPRENAANWSKAHMSQSENPLDPFGLGPGAVFEGPFGDHTGFYSLPDRYPLLEVTAITHRRDPIYPTTIVGLPPQEDYYLGKATERIFLPLLRTIVPDIIDYDLPMFGAFHHCAFLKIKKEYPFHARRVMHAIWGAGQMSWTKTIVVVDADVNVHDHDAVLRAVGEECVPARDSELARGPLDILDHAAPFLGAGGKLGLDATRKDTPAETHRAMDPLAAELRASAPILPALGEDARTVESRVRSLPGVLDAIVPDALGGWWLLVRLGATNSGDADRLIKGIGALANDCHLPRWTVVVGPDANLADVDGALFHWMAGYSPDRDRVLSVCGRRVAFDATPKHPGMERHGQPARSFPPMLRMSDDVRGSVTRRWREYAL